MTSRSNRSRHTSRALLLLVVASIAVAGRPAGAQEAARGDDSDQAQKPPTQTRAKPPAAPPKTPPRREPAFSVQGFGSFGYTSFVASDTFDAVLGSSGGASFGGGMRVAHRSGFFFQVDLSRFSDSGERVFVYEGEVFPLGIPLDVSVTPIEFSGGYRFLPRPKPAPKPPARPPARSPAQAVTTSSQRPAPPAQGQKPVTATARRPRLIPYVGGGIGFVQYKEDSPFGQSGDAISESFTSYHVLGGLEIPLTRWLGTGVVVNYRWVPNALGEGGASKEFGETDLGGFTFRALLTVGR